MTNQPLALSRLANLLQSMCRREPSQDGDDSPLYYKVSVHLVEDMLKALRPAPVQHQRRETGVKVVSIVERIENSLRIFDVHIGEWNEGEIPEFQVFEHSHRVALITNPCEGWSGGSEDAADFQAGLAAAIEVARSLDTVV